MLGTYLQSYQYEALPSQPFYEFAGLVTNSPQAGGTQPHWRSYTTLEWERHHWDVRVANNYVSGVLDEGAGGATFLNSHATPIRVASYSTWDAQLGYTFGEGMLAHMHEARLIVGINNAFNRMPPAAPKAFPDNGADVSTYSPIGRLIYAQLTATF
jgi:iron complex outermembrane receptor protein